MFCDVFGLEFTFPLKFSKKTSGGEFNDIFSLPNKEIHQNGLYSVWVGFFSFQFCPPFI
jgi:hypothetical protein